MLIKIDLNSVYCSRVSSIRIKIRKLKPTERMERSELVQVMMVAIDEAVKIFDELFDDIACIEKHRKRHSSMAEQDIRFGRNQLNARQREAVKHLSGFLSKAANVISSIRYDVEDKQISDDDPQSRINSLQLCLQEKDRAAIRDARQIAALQAFLVQELKRADGFENLLKIKDQELVNVRAEMKDKTKDAIIVKKSSNKVSDPEVYLNRYVRKKFKGTFYFGRIVLYESPYYTVVYPSSFPCSFINYFLFFLKVVYEDADDEDLTKTELQPILWDDDVPMVIADLCQKHFQQFEIEQARKALRLQEEADLAKKQAKLNRLDELQKKLQSSASRPLPSSSSSSNPDIKHKPKAEGEPQVTKVGGKRGKAQANRHSAGNQGKLRQGGPHAPSHVLLMNGDDNADGDFEAEVDGGNKVADASTDEPLRKKSREVTSDDNHCVVTNGGHDEITRPESGLISAADDRSGVSVRSQN